MLLRNPAVLSKFSESTFSMLFVSSVGGRAVPLGKASDDSKFLFGVGESGATENSLFQALVIPRAFTTEKFS